MHPTLFIASICAGRWDDEAVDKAVRLWRQAGQAERMWLLQLINRAGVSEPPALTEVLNDPKLFRSIVETRSYNTANQVDGVLKKDTRTLITNKSPLLAMVIETAEDLNESRRPLRSSSTASSAKEPTHVWWSILLGLMLCLSVKDMFPELHAYAVHDFRAEARCQLKDFDQDTMNHLSFLQGVLNLSLIHI